MKRTVVVTHAAYLDVEGRGRTAWRGDEINVHPDSVERFDANQAAAVAELVADSLPVEVAAVIKATKPRSTRAKANG